MSTKGQHRTHYAAYALLLGRLRSTPVDYVLMVCEGKDFDSGSNVLLGNSATQFPSQCSTRLPFIELSIIHSNTTALFRLPSATETYRDIALCTRFPPSSSDILPSEVPSCWTIERKGDHSHINQPTTAGEGYVNYPFCSLAYLSHVVVGVYLSPRNTMARKTALKHTPSHTHTDPRPDRAH